MTNLIKRLFIPNYQNTADPAVRARYGTVAGAVGIVTNVLLAVAKVVIGAVFGAIAIVADGINNLSDSLSSIITMVGFKLSAAQADEEHPYGHGRMEYLSGLVVAAIIDRGIGGGDMKLMAVAGLFLGWQEIILLLRCFLSTTLSSSTSGTISIMPILV